MNILDEIKEDCLWDEFLEYKKERRHLSAKELKWWTDFVQNREYREITDRLAEGNYHFDYPDKICVNKSGTGKKRIVYSYNQKESAVLKAIAYLLYRYDDKMNAVCYSFRREQTAKDAIGDILHIKNLEQKYSLKADVSNYFNSIPVDRLVAVLKEVITDDEPLVAFLEELLKIHRAYENGIVIEGERGAMAGIPIAPFFANIYLMSVDNAFTQKGINYYRYSDDILLFADNEEELNEYETLLYDLIAEKGLAMNPEKIKHTKPGETWEFLGFAYHDGKVDLSHVTKNKLKAKIRRKAHALYRWRTKKNVDYEHAAKAMIRIFNRKFYDDADENRFTWSRWFFPVLTTDEGLKEMDAYLIQYIRYLYSGRHYKGNYRVTYEDIKVLGFRSLVNEYYRWKELS